MPKSEKRRGALTRIPSKTSAVKAERGKVYTGGTPAFNENKGRYVAPPSGSVRLSPGVYRAPGGQLMTGQGRALPPQGQRLIQSMNPLAPRDLQSLVQGVANQPVKRPLAQPAPNEQLPMTPPPVDMQRPWMNFQPPQMPQAPGSRVPQMQQLSFGQVANMSGDQLQQYIDQLQQMRQAQQQTNMQSWLQMQGPWVDYADAQRRG